MPTMSWTEVGTRGNIRRLSATHERKETRKQFKTSCSVLLALRRLLSAATLSQDLEG